MSDTALASRSKPSLILRLLQPLDNAWLRGPTCASCARGQSLPKFVIVAAHHKTNWDPPNALAAGLHYGVRIHWTGEESLFR